jgi:hypothetical protein
MGSRARRAGRRALGCLAVTAALASCGQDQPDLVQPALEADAPRHAVERVARGPVGGPGVLTAERDHAGRPVRARCSSCHAKNDTARADANTLQDMHTGLTLRHGPLCCGQCHGADAADGTKDYDLLRLADGSGVAFDEAMTLCAQCHGPQTRDYDHGAHGGMRGHWDLRLGPRTRNQCIHCHDPHAPAYVGMVPAPGPRDRFMRRAERHPEDRGGH